MSVGDISILAEIDQRPLGVSSGVSGAVAVPVAVTVMGTGTGSVALPTPMPKRRGRRLMLKSTDEEEVGREVVEIEMREM